MKKIILIAWLVGATGVAQAQYRAGNLGYVTAGTESTDFSRNQADLNRADILGPSLRLNQLGIAGGVGVYHLYPSRWLTGLTADLTNFRQSGTRLGQVDARTSTGLLNVGYAVVRSHQWLLFPHAGAGIGFTRLTVINPSALLLPLDRQEPVQPGETRIYTNTGPAFDLGVSVQRFIGNSARGNQSKPSVVIGFDAGLHLIVGRERWAYAGNEKSFDGLAKPNIKAAYIRLTLGLFHPAND